MVYSCPADRLNVLQWVQPVEDPLRTPRRLRVQSSWILTPDRSFAENDGSSVAGGCVGATRGAGIRLMSFRASLIMQAERGLWRGGPREP